MPPGALRKQRRNLASRYHECRIRLGGRVFRPVRFGWQPRRRHQNPWRRITGYRGLRGRGTAVAVGTDRWYLVTARSADLIAAIKDECIVAELLRFTANVSNAAAEACLR